MTAKNVLIVLNDEQEGPVTPLVDRMKGAGLSVTSVMEDLGMVRGTIDEADLSALKSVPGVMNVEEEETVQLPPPHSVIQ